MCTIIIKKGIAACSTCHVIIEPEWFAKLPEIEEAEMDMLDMAADLQDTSRLGCQLTLDAQLDGMVFHIPKNVINYH